MVAVRVPVSYLLVYRLSRLLRLVPRQLESRGVIALGGDLGGEEEHSLVEPADHWDLNGLLLACRHNGLLLDWLLLLGSREAALVRSHIHMLLQGRGVL